MSVAANSQTSQTSKDSVKVAVKDMDKAALKMIEGKKYKLQFQASQKALSDCDAIKKELNDKVSTYEVTASDLKEVNSNLNKNLEETKTLLENEKKLKFRTGFYGFLKGVGIGGTLTAAFFIFK